MNYFYTNNQNILSRFVFTFILSLFPTFLNAQQLAFPDAEGYGRYTKGGRGGSVYEVTNLSDAGVGSFRYGVEASGARTIVFRVSGTIELTKSLNITNGNLTIAGQTAPGDGICFKSKKIVVPSSALTSVVTLQSFNVVVDADEVIIRYIHFRPGDEIDNSVGAPVSNIKFENDGVFGRNHKNIIIDHCSMSWAIDEVASFYDNADFTMQWCLLGESLTASFHPKGNHGYGGIWGGWGASFHHNLIADNTSRNPRFCGARYHTTTASAELVDFRNNVIFNWGGNSAYGGEGGQQNMINNYYKPGPATKKKGGSQAYRLISPSVSTDPKVDTVSKWYLTGNVMEGNTSVTNNNYKGGGFQPDNADSVLGLWARYAAPFKYADVNTQTALDAYNSVVEKCGASIYRDAVDQRIIDQVKTGTATTGGSFGANTGIIDTPTQVGGWPVLNSTTAPPDSDHDGMPDAWEISQNLNPNNASDRNTVTPEGYTMLEKYLNSILSSTPTSVSVIETKPKFTCNPNPASKSTQIGFYLAVASQVNIAIRDLTGREIRIVSQQNYSAGEHSINCNLSFLKPGLYLVELTAGTVRQVKKLYKTIE